MVAGHRPSRYYIIWPRAVSPTDGDRIKMVETRAKTRAASAYYI